MSKCKIVYALLVLENGQGVTPLHLLAQPLIHDFEDVFHDDYPKDWLQLEALNIKSMYNPELLHLKM